MDLATQLALRAVVRGLFHADAITAAQVHSVASALKDAAGTAMEQRDPDAAKELLNIAKAIKTDTAVA